jgi:hypothetical protein
MNFKNLQKRTPGRKKAETKPKQLENLQKSIDEAVTQISNIRKSNTRSASKKRATRVMKMNIAGANSKERSAVWQ